MEQKEERERERKKELDSTSILANPQLRKRLDFLRPLRQWEKHQPFSTCLSTAKIDWIYLNDTLSHLSPPASIEIIQASIIRFSLVKYSNISPENGLISPVGERWGGRWGRRWGGRWGGERGGGAKRGCATYKQFIKMESSIIRQQPVATIVPNRYRRVEFFSGTLYSHFSFLLSFSFLISFVWFSFRFSFFIFHFGGCLFHFPANRSRASL